MLKEVTSKDEIEKFGKYKVELIKEHQYYANKLGINDKMVEKYDFDKAIRYVGIKGYHQFLLINDKKIIGIMEYKIEKSEIDNKEILYLKNIFIKEEYRGKGFGKKVINELKKLNYRIELECWYGMPANKFYQELGFENLKTRYMFKTD